MKQLLPFGLLAAALLSVPCLAADPAPALLTAQYKQDEFMARYHKRSNVESLFSAVKRKFSDHVRSRTPDAMVNEALAKLLCNNLCCVILSQCELGIKAELWKNRKAAVNQAQLPTGARAIMSM
jgi:hypothetical protein